MFSRILFLLMMCLCCFTGAHAFQVDDKMYIDDDEFSAKVEGDAFHIHVGNNVWLVTHSVHRDARGLFAYECNLSKSMKGVKMEYEKKWKCPYCYNYWPIGQPCGNAQCPSKYK